MTAELDFHADLSAAIGGLTAEMRAERERKLQLALDVSYISAPAMQFSALPGQPDAWGPKTGYAWAVQRVTVAGLGATSDFAIAYRGKSTNDAQPQNALFTFQEAVAGGTATWHPGRTGLILKGNEGLVFGGTFTGSKLVVSIDVIQLAISKLAYFLL